MRRKTLTLLIKQKEKSVGRKNPIDFPLNRKHLKNRKYEK